LKPYYIQEEKEEETRIHSTPHPAETLTVPTKAKGYISR